MGLAERCWHEAHVAFKLCQQRTPTPLTPPLYPASLSLSLSRLVGLFVSYRYKRGKGKGLGGGD